MAKEYYLKFGSGNPTLTTGLSPSFAQFKSWTGGTVTPPGITQPIAGWGLYRFEYSPSFSIMFVADGATSSLSNNDRYVMGVLDPADSVDERVADVGTSLIAAGITLAAIGTSLLAFSSSLGLVATAIGTTASSYGTDSVDPATVFGLLKRIQEFLEGNATYTKSSGLWDVYTRGSSQLLREKTFVNSNTSTTKT